MKKALKVLGIATGALVGVIVIALVVVYVLSQRKISEQADVAGHAIPIPSDSATIERGRHVVNAFGMCGDCHGPDLGGMTMINSAPVAVLASSNLTAGNGGIGGTYTDLDWERAIRHGVGPNRVKLLFMPSHEYSQLNDADFAALVAYIKQIPKVDRARQPNSVGPVFRALLLKGDLELLPSDLMDQWAKHPAVLEPAPTVEYGNYLAVTCRGCHGHGFSGGPTPGAPPEWKPAANITPTGIGHYTEADFVTVLRTGKRPDGSMSDTTQMPVRYTKNLNDIELQALYAFFKTVPGKAYGGR